MDAGLVTEGSSDRALLPILRWLLDELFQGDGSVEWIDTRVLGAETDSLTKKVQAALQAYPCDLLFVHRDSDPTGRTRSFATQRCGRPLERSATSQSSRFG